MPFLCNWRLKDGMIDDDILNSNLQELETQTWRQWKIFFLPWLHANWETYLNSSVESIQSSMHPLPQLSLHPLALPFIHHIFFPSTTYLSVSHFMPPAIRPFILLSMHNHRLTLSSLISVVSPQWTCEPTASQLIPNGEIKVMYLQGHSCWASPVVLLCSFAPARPTEV